mgnify:CR=1 FL=1
MLRVSSNPVVDTVVKLASTAVIMFAFVFVVMVPLYNVLCDALGINGKTSGEAYTSVQAGHGGPGHSQRVALPGRGVFPQNRVLLL